MDYTTLTKEDIICLKKLTQIFRDYSYNFKFVSGNGVFGVYNDSLQKWWDNIEKYYDDKWVDSFVNKMVGFNFLNEDNNGKAVKINGTRKIYFSENNISQINFAIAQREIQKKNKVLNFGLNILGGFVASVVFWAISKML